MAIGSLFKTLTFDGENSGDFGVYITGEAVYNAPERAVEMISVPGRNGSIALDQGRFENIEVSYPAGVFAETQAEFAQAVREFRNALCSKIGYFRLADEYHPDEYRMAIYKNGLEVGPENIGRAGMFNVVFDCKPQRFLLDGEETRTVEYGQNPNSIYNPTRFPSKPLIEVVGYGTLTMGDYSIVVTGTGAQDVFIDCETLEAYSMSGGIPTPKNDKVSFGNQTPVLAPGNNVIGVDANMSTVKIQPRWFVL